MFLHLVSFITCKTFLRFDLISLIDCISLIFIFLLSNFDLPKNRFGSPIDTIGIFKFSHDLEEAILIIKSGQIPAGSPGE